MLRACLAAQCRRLVRAGACMHPVAHCNQHNGNAGAVLLYLAERHGGRFIPKDASTRAQMTTWLMFQMVLASLLRLPA